MLGPIGLGYDRGNDRLLVQLEELVATELDDDDDDDDEDPRCLRRRRRTAATSASTSPAARRRRSATTPTKLVAAGRPNLHVVRQPDRPRWPPVPADELTPSGVPSDALAHPVVGGDLHRGSDAVGQQRHVPRPPGQPSDGPPAASTSRRAANARCGTSSPGCTSAPWRRTGCKRGDGHRRRATHRVLREDGPLGEGSVQWYVDADHREHYFTIEEQLTDLHDQLRALAPPRHGGQQHRPQERPDVAEVEVASLPIEARR